MDCTARASSGDSAEDILQLKQRKAGAGGGHPPRPSGDFTCVQRALRMPHGEPELAPLPSFVCYAQSPASSIGPAWSAQHQFLQHHCLQGPAFFFLSEF